MKRSLTLWQLQLEKEEDQKDSKSQNRHKKQIHKKQEHSCAPTIDYPVKLLDVSQAWVLA